MNTKSSINISNVGCVIFFLFFCFCITLHAETYEAENAVLNGVEPKAHVDASGGFRVVFFDAVGDFTRFDNVVSNERLIITYSLGLPDSKQCSVYFDGVDAATAVFQPTGSWDTYADLEVPLSANSEIMLKLDSDDQSANNDTSCSSVDKIEVTTAAAPAYWRSSLYPENWMPGYKDSQGRFLHDFSYAGYRKGQANLAQTLPSMTINVTESPYNADNTGNTDSTVAIQSAINAASSNGGAIVYLPEGKYKVSPQNGNSYSLLIYDSNIIMCGDGPDKTRIFNDETYMRSKTVISVSPVNGYSAWFNPVAGSEIAITTDLPEGSQILPLASTAGLAVGDWVIVRTDCTEDFIADHNMTGIWTASLKGITVYRKITDIDPVAKTISIDIPTRYWMKTRDNARIYKVADHIDEVGIEHLAIGMRENPKSGHGDLDYEVPGTAAWEVHSSHAIKFTHVVNGWISDFETYRPEENTGNYHTLSNVILLNRSRNITVRACNVACPQYEGGGGNGYGYTLSSNDCLLVDCKAYHTRHNYDFKSMWSSGNVIYRCETKDPRLRSDFHMHLSPANLIDSNYVINDTWEARYRPYGTIIHGHTTTQSVFWNTYGEGGKSPLIESKQWGMGYVIGTSGPMDVVVQGNSYGSDPEDFLEGEGLGQTLEPQSLFVDQLIRRNGLIPSYLIASATDLNKDGVTDWLDLAIFMQHWLDCGAIPHCN